MRTTSKPFLALTAADLMSGPVVTIPKEMSLQGAAHLLARFSISGAPVVDTDGRCVGVLSTTDFVSWAERAEQTTRRIGGYADCAHTAWQVLDVENFPEDAVARYMTPDPVTVAPDAHISDLARMMTDAHIHRVIVVDGQHQPVGIVSSTDILAAVAYTGKHR
jgi:CBS-domain-containing membrane protein